MSGTSQIEIVRTVGTPQDTVNGIIQTFRNEECIRDATHGFTVKNGRWGRSSHGCYVQWSPVHESGPYKRQPCPEYERCISWATTSGSGPRWLKCCTEANAFWCCQEERAWRFSSPCPATADDWRNMLFTDECTIFTEWNQKQKVYRPALASFILPSLLKFCNVIVYNSGVWCRLTYICPYG